jgi:hypothetical protein
LLVGASVGKGAHFAQTNPKKGEKGMKKQLLIAALLTATATTKVWATHGINLIGIGPVQQGTAGAGVASAKDSTWFILNPAGLADIQPSFDLSFQVFAPERSLDSTVSCGA